MYLIDATRLPPSTSGTIAERAGRLSTEYVKSTKAVVVVWFGDQDGPRPECEEIPAEWYERF